MGPCQLQYYWTHDRLRKANRIKAECVDLTKCLAFLEFPRNSGHPEDEEGISVDVRKYAHDYCVDITKACAHAMWNVQ